MCAGLYGQPVLWMILQEVTFQLFEIIFLI